MSQLAQKRIRNQIKEIKENPPILWQLKQNSQKWTEWTVTITTESNTPFHSIPITLTVIFDEKYPHEAPKIKLQNSQKFFHPNINHKYGSICQKTLASKSPTLKARDRIQAFIDLLGIPNPNSPLNHKAAKMFDQNYRQYYRNALHIFRGYQKMIQ